MPTYNSIMDRSSDVGALIPTEYEQQIFQEVPQQSAVMQLARRLRDMSKQETELRVVDGLATAYFATSGTAAAGDNARLQTSEVSFGNKTVKATKMGVIVPIPRDVLEDADYDIWGEIQPQLTEAFGKTFDAAVLHGTNAPSDWPDDLMTGIASASHSVEKGTNDDLYDDLLGESGVLSFIEADGYMSTGHVAAMSLRSSLRSLRTTDGIPIFQADMKENFQYSLDGEPLVFPKNGGLSTAAALLITGDWSKVVYSIRKGITYEVLTEASIHDGSGTLQYNLAQDDMVALKATMRLGWQILTPPTRLNSSPYPFAALTPAA